MAGAAPTENPQAGQDLSAMKAQQAHTQTVANLLKEVSLLKQVGENQGQIAKIQEFFNKEMKRELKAHTDKISAMREEGKISGRALDNLQKEAEQIIEIAAQNKINGRYLEEISKLTEEITKRNRQNVAIYDAGTEKLKAQGNYIRANIRDMAKEKFTDPATGNVSAGHIVKGAVDIAKDPAEMMLQAMGPWGILIKMMLGVFDQIRKTRGQLEAASAASGHFATNFSTISREAEGLSSQGGELMAKFGMSMDEATDLMVGLKKTGIESFGKIDQGIMQIGGGLSKTATEIFTFAKNTGLGMDIITKYYKSLVYNFGANANNVRGVIDKVYGAARTLADKQIMTMDDAMTHIMSISEAFMDLGVRVEGVANIVQNVGEQLDKLKWSKDMLPEIAKGIIGIGRASEGWKVMAQKMAGGGQGYVQSLFAFQQRKGIVAPGGGEMDPIKQFQTVRTALNKMTAGISGMNKQYMIEKLGAQYGLTERGTYIMQQMSAGKMTQTEGVKNWKQMMDQAKQNKIDTVGILERIQKIIEGFIIKPLVGIFRIISMAPLFGGTVSQKAASAELSERVESGNFTNTKNQMMEKSYYERAKEKAKEEKKGAKFLKIQTNVKGKGGRDLASLDDLFDISGDMIRHITK